MLAVRSRAVVTLDTLHVVGHHRDRQIVLLLQENPPTIVGVRETHV